MPKRGRTQQKRTAEYSGDEEECDYASDDEDIVPTHATVKLPGRKSAPSNVEEFIDCTDLKLKKDHENRPLWISPEGTIYLEAFAPVAEQAIDFLVAIAEPVSRPSFIHEYRLTAYSLYAAVSIGLETEDIIQVLERLSKTVVPENIVEFIRDNTSSFGKLKLVLKHGRYFVESSYPDVLQVLLKDEVIRDLIVKEETDEAVTSSTAAKQNKIVEITDNGAPVEQDEDLKAPKTGDIFIADLNIEDENVDDDEEDRVYSFEINSKGVETLRRRCNHIDHPLIEEYDFHNDTLLPNLDIDLKPTTVIRPYQEKCLSKMFGNGRSRSGIIVLPCGAGKTLVGITAACTLKKSTLVLCTSAVSVEQWRSQFKLWSTVQDHNIARFTSESKEQFSGDAGIVISTYTMVAYSGKRSYEAQKMMDFITNVEWGFLLLDEVHVVPANVFRKVLTNVAAHTKLGLTATLVREDDKITDLNFLIGPKLYEANWLDLAKKGHIANVQCAEVWCPMTAEFYAEYLKASSRKRRLLYVMNPNKFRACQFLIQYHERRGDKIIVFSDDVYALISYAKTLMKPYICGPTSQTERMRILQYFQNDPTCNTIFLSKVGDTSIDLPEATCLIQISSHYGSRRQEAQRLGRILRAKRRNDEGFNAFFYSLVSQDTQEMYYSTKRQQFLIDQGYAFKVIVGLPPSVEDAKKSKDPHMVDVNELVYATKQSQLKLLNDVLLATDADLKDAEEDVAIADDISKLPMESDSRGPKAKVRKSTSGLKSLAGADNMAYIEVQKTDKREPKRERSAFFKKFLG